MGLRRLNKHCQDILSEVQLSCLASSEKRELSQCLNKSYCSSLYGTYSVTSSWRLTLRLTRRDVVQTLFKSCSFAAEQLESVMKFENSGVLMRAWQNKIAHRF